MGKNRGLWPLAVAGLVLLAPLAQAQDEGQGPGEEPPLETVPVPPLEEPEEEFAPLLPSVQWTTSGNVQMDAVSKADLPAERQNDSELRRARLSGLLERNHWRFKVAVELADDAGFEELSTPLRELSFEYRGWPVYLEFGLLPEPFGVLQGGSRGASLMERPQPTALGTGYGIGIAANLRGERWGFALGSFLPFLNDVYFGGREEAAPVTARGTLVPLRFDDGLVHVGAGASLRAPVDAQLQFVSIPETILLLGLNTSSADMLVDDYWLYGAEAAVQAGPVLVQAEYFNADISDGLVSDNAFPIPSYTAISPSYTGHYVEAAWAITGERRDYSTRRGMFGGIEPRSPLFGGGIGAIELAARRSEIDLSDERGLGERGEVSSLALNWYPVEYVKLMAEALEIVEERPNGTREEVSAVQARAQLHFSVP